MPRSLSTVPWISSAPIGLRLVLHPNGQNSAASPSCPLAINQTGLIGYSFNLICAMAQAHFFTGNQSIANKWAPAIVSMLDWADSKIENGLFTLNNSAYVGDWNYYDPPQTGASAKFNTLYAYSLQQSRPLLQAAGVNTTVYDVRLDNLRKAINDRLWNSTLGAYVLSSEIADGFAQDAQAFAILAGVPQSNGISPSSILQMMDEKLLLDAGHWPFRTRLLLTDFPARSVRTHRLTIFALRSRSAMEIGPRGCWRACGHLWPIPRTLITQTACGRLSIPTALRALVRVPPCATAGVLGPLPTQQARSGCDSTAPGFEEWQVKPVTLDLASATGRQPTPRGGIKVLWIFDNDLLRMEIDGPEGGKIYLPQPLRIALEDSTFDVNGKIIGADEFRSAFLDAFPFSSGRTEAQNRFMLLLANEGRQQSDLIEMSSLRKSTNRTFASTLRRSGRSG